MYRRETGSRAHLGALTAAPLLLGVACGGGSSAPPEPIAVVGAVLIDGTMQGPLGDAVVLVRDGRFECVGDRVSCPLPPDARLIDGTGHWVLPAFIDTHVHLWWLQDSVWTAQAQVLRLAAGITTVREMASAHQLSAVLALAQRAKNDSYPGPRIFVSGRVAARANRDNTAATFGHLVTELIERGVDGLKIKTHLTPDRLAGVLETAEGRGIDVYGHATDVATNAQELEGAFRMGLDGVNHVVLLAPLLQADEGQSRSMQNERPAWIDLWRTIDPALEDRLITAMVAEDVWLEPTLVGVFFRVNPGAHAGAPALPYLPAEMAADLAGDTLPSGSAEAAAESIRRMGEFVDRFKARGGMVVAGTDQLEYPGFGLHEEMALLVGAGLTPSEALRAATSEAASALGWQDRVGTIEIGKVADMVILTSDPLADIRNTREIRVVFKGGVAYDPRELVAGLVPRVSP